MQLKTALSEISGLHYLVEQLDLQSSLGKRYLYATKFITDAKIIENELNRIEQMIGLITNCNFTKTIGCIKLKISQLHDIKTTLQNISKQLTLDDIELFEVKRFCLICTEIECLLAQLNIQIVSIPPLLDPLCALDPEQNRLPNFYIYDIYSENLTDIRTQIKQLKKETATPETDSQIDTLTQQSIKIEDQIRKELSEKLYTSHSQILEATEKLAYLDILIAKAQQAKALNLCKPTISINGTTSFSELFNPQIQENIIAAEKKYQPIDFKLEDKPCLITGANMSGKTVLLKTIALTQYLLQFGFYIPAKQADISLVESVLLCIDNHPLEQSGLSSFASEMLKINDIITKIKSNTKALVLIDELARSTNPHEGSALVSAMLDILAKYNIKSLITTHYTVSTSCRKMRVKGFISDNITEKVTLKNIHNFVDYSLEEDFENGVPTDAMRIASIIGVDNDLISIALKYTQSPEHKKKIECKKVN